MSAPGAWEPDRPPAGLRYARQALEQSSQQPGQGGLPQDAPDPQAGERFRQALAGEAGEAAEAAPAPDPAAAPPTPFHLLGGLGKPPPGPHPRASELDRRITEAIDQLLVGQGRGGGRQVRLAFKDDVLPGVTLVIDEREGRLEIEFSCSHEPSRRLLLDRGPALACQLAQRLRRELLLAVQTDDPDDPCRAEWVEHPGSHA